MTSKLVIGSLSPAARRNCSNRMSLPREQLTAQIIHRKKRIAVRFAGRTSTIGFCLRNYKSFLMRCRRSLSKVSGKPHLTQGRVVTPQVTCRGSSTFRSLTDEWAQRVYAAHCESWSQQNRKVTGEFVRAVRDRAIVPLIATRKATVQSGVSLRGTRTGEKPNPVSLGNWNRRIERLAAPWSRRLEADAVAEEYRAARPVDANDDRHFELMAIEEARKSIPEDGRPHPRVGVVIVKEGKVLAKAHRGESPKSHAEYVALEQKLSGETLAGAAVYTTLEPCIKRNPPKICCAQRLAERKVARVFIGMLDPNPDIRGLGDQLLSEAGIDIQLFPRDLRVQVEEMNREFIRDQKQKFRARQSLVEIQMTKQSVSVEAEPQCHL